jgi:hypothetical protein
MRPPYHAVAYLLGCLLLVQHDGVPVRRRHHLVSAPCVSMSRHHLSVRISGEKADGHGRLC